jgi:hypothetical protein
MFAVAHKQHTIRTPQNQGITCSEAGSRQGQTEGPYRVLRYRVLRYGMLRYRYHYQGEGMGNLTKPFCVIQFPKSSRLT